jgi:hypothetical protein
MPQSWQVTRTALRALMISLRCGRNSLTRMQGDWNVTGRGGGYWDGKNKRTIVTTMPTDLPRPKRPPRNHHPQRLRWRILWEAIIAVAIAVVITEIIASMRFVFG